ncbi:MAG TPA: phospholipase D-like domain-containing protein [Gammaproteobacteria bacterium]|nr:phospholipase D-like domain-containing protein [Gammaproteobacteria bacterium]
MSDKKPPLLFRWCHGNQFRLLIDGNAFFSAMLDAIAGARRQILLEMYLVESGQIADRFIDALGSATQRGVQVCMLLDDFGCRGLTAADRSRLRAHGIELVLYNPLQFGTLRRNLFRDHRKLLVVDGNSAFVGGAGITDAFDESSQSGRHWHDVMVEIRGPLVSDWQTVFDHNWSHWATTAAPLINISGSKTGLQTGRVSLAGTDALPTIKRTLLQRLSRAEQRIWLATAYFVPSWKLRRRLARAARRGVDVRLLLPGPHTDHPAVRHAGRRFYRHLLAAGVRIFEYQPRFQHAKVALIDNWVAVGSSNLDRWNLRWNLEANQEIDAPDFAAATAAMFTTDFSASQEYLAHTWGRRGHWSRFAERFWGAVDRWLDRHSRR